MKIFQPDNFSPYKIKYKKIPRSLINFEKILNKYFSYYQIIRISQLDRKEINSENFQIVIKISGKQKKVLLRKNKILSNSEQVNFYLRLLIRLAGEGVPVSEVIRNKNNWVFTIVDNNIYTLFKFIESNHFKPSEKAFVAVAEAGARMHAAFNRLDKKSVSRIKHLSGRSNAYFNKIKKYSLADFEKIKGLIKNKKSISEPEKSFLAAVPLIAETIKKINVCKRDIKKLSLGVIHSDLHPHNILMQGNYVGAIIDFDSVRLSQQGRDIASIIYRFGRQFFVASNVANKKQMATRLKNIFLDKYCEIRPLSEKEKLLLPILLKDEFLTKLLFVLKGIYEENNLAWAGDLIKFIVPLQEIDYFWADIL